MITKESENKVEPKYNHLDVEKDKNNKWIEKKFFSTHTSKDKPFSIILPPPNVTGKLHLGHAWDGYIQDTIIRYKKLMGFDVLFVPGLDHAGIATQAKVEEKIRKELKTNRYALGREKFLEKIWEWKDEYANEIRSQWAKLGLALDYSNERFTMDEGSISAVQKVFITMYKNGLIYRGERAINWDPALQTVLSNIEVIATETKSKMYYFAFDIYDQENEQIVIATTRPETMFSDVAIAINPHDEEMKRFTNKKAISPLTGEILPIIQSELIELGKGTGAMKVSAHAEMDIEIIKANNLTIKECIDKYGKMTSIAGEYHGMDRFETRKKVVDKLKNSLVKIDDIINSVGRSERSGEIIETLVQPQWFVKMPPLAKKILENLNTKDGVEFYPTRFSEVLENWMENAQDWCISRQLWWGHRIPAWYKDDEVKVQIESPGENWTQDDDVLDTWFSSALAPFSFLGWPNDETKLKKFYPTSLLVTGYDIIFFWVARMYFQGLEFMNKRPFNKVLIHGLIRAEDGQKMSKSLGNGIDPMDVIEKYGSDALRYFLLTNSTPGQDLRFSTQKVEAAWNLNNKLWNIARYIITVMPENDAMETEADIWIYSKLSKLASSVQEKMETFEFTIIGKEINHFIMDDFSSWYIEFTKSTPNKKVAKDILKKLMIILHPFLPFITDHIFKLIDDSELLDQVFPTFNIIKSNSYIDRVITIVRAIREFRDTKRVSITDKIFYYASVDLSDEEISMINHLTNSDIKINNDALIPLDGFNLFIELSAKMKKTEQDRIEKEIEFLNKEIIRAQEILSNENFLAKAPKEKINNEQKKLDSFLKRLAEISK